MCAAAYLYRVELSGARGSEDIAAPESTRDVLRGAFDGLILPPIFSAGSLYEKGRVCETKVVLLLVVPKLGWVENFQAGSRHNITIISNQVCVCTTRNASVCGG